MLNRIILILVISCLFFCKKEEKIIYLKSKNVNGLSEKSKITMNGYTVGKIKSFNLLENGNIIITSILDNTINIPIDSKFYIGTEGFLDSRKILINKGIEKEVVQNNDTLILANNTINQMETLFNINDSIKKNDSLLIEIKKINQKLNIMEERLEKLEKSK